MAEEDAIRTAFHEVTAAQGRDLRRRRRLAVARGLGDVRYEHAEAARDDVAVWDVSPLNKWEFQGPTPVGRRSTCSRTTPRT